MLPPSNLRKRIKVLQAYPRVGVIKGDVGVVVKDCGTNHFEIKFENDEILILHESMFKFVK